MQIEGFTHKYQDGDPRISAFVSEGDGPTVVLIPGTWGPAGVLEDIARGLDEAFNVILLEVPGQGDNWPPPEDKRMEVLTESAFVALEHLGVERFYIGGHSLGGMIAIDMIRLCRERLLGVISIEGWTHYTVSKDAFGGEVTSRLTGEQLAEREKRRKRIFERWDDEERQEYATIWRRWNGYDLLANTDVPILEIWGDRGKPTPSLKDMRIPHRPNIEIHWVEGCSHSLPVEAPGEVAAAINEFVTRTDAATPKL